MLFLGIIPWNSVPRFNEGEGGCISDWEGSFLSGAGGGECPMRGHRFWWGGFLKKTVGWGGRHPHAPLTMGNPAHCYYVKTWNNSTCSIRDGISPQGERWGLNFATRSYPYDFGVISIFFSSWAYVALNMWYIIFIIESIYRFLKNWLDNDLK